MLRRPPAMSLTFFAKSLAYSWKMSLDGQVLWKRKAVVCAVDTAGAAAEAALAGAASGFLPQPVTTTAAAAVDAFVRKRRRCEVDRVMERVSWLNGGPHQRSCASRGTGPALPWRDSVRYAAPLWKRHRKRDESDDDAPIVGVPFAARVGRNPCHAQVKETARSLFSGLRSCLRRSDTHEHRDRFA